MIYANHDWARPSRLFDQVLRHSRCGSQRGATLSDEPLPDERHYYILEPRHSACHQTPMGILLRKLDVAGAGITEIAVHLADSASTREQST